MDALMTFFNLPLNCELYCTPPLLSEHNFSNIYGQFISIIDSVLPKGFRKSVWNWYSTQ